MVPDTLCHLLIHLGGTQLFGFSHNFRNECKSKQIVPFSVLTDSERSW